MSQSMIFLIRDDQGNPVKGATVNSTAGGTYSDQNGSAILTLDSSTVGQTLTFTVSCPGYSTATLSQSVPLYTQTVPVTLTYQTQESATGITISDGQNPVPGASVFLNGASAGSTDSLGHIVLNLNAGTNQLSIEADGFTPYQTSLVAGVAPSIIYIVPITSGFSYLSLVISPPGATYVLGTEAGTVGSDGQVQTQNQYPPDTYSVTWTYNGASRTDSFVVTAGQTVYSFAPLPVSDSGNQNTGVAFSDGSAAAASSSQPGSTTTSLTPGSTSTPPVSADTDSSLYEFIAPSFNYGRYFTGTQVRMYIGNLFIEELNAIQFVLQANKVPVYGYASSEFDALGSGRALVSGQVMLNFISEGYLYTALNEFKKKTQAPANAANSAFANLLSAENTVRTNSALSPADQASQLASLKTQRQQLIASNPSILTAYQRNQISSLAVEKGPNALYTNIPFDLVFQLEGGGRSVTRKISNCVLISNEQVVADNDTTLLDCYGFIGRRLL